MKFNIISYTLIIFVMVLLYPYLIYAPWTILYPPKPPQDDILRNCAQWINYNGFTLDNYQLNREKAITRDVMKDRVASIWAALYAFKIGGLQDLYKILPQDFCNSFGPENIIPKGFRTIRDEYKNCVDWIKLYGFREYDHSYNYTYAKNTDPIKIIYISIWAYAYWVYVWRFGQTFQFTPREICSKMGKNVGEYASPMPFMCEYVTKLNCREWIYLFDYNDDPVHNMYKAIALNDATLNYHIHIHYFPCSYAILLQTLLFAEESINEMTPMEFCKKYDGYGNEPQKYGLDFKEE